MAYERREAKPRNDADDLALVQACEAEGGSMRVMSDADAGRLVIMLLRGERTDDVRVVRDANVRELDHAANRESVAFLADSRLLLALANAELARRII